MNGKKLICSGEQLSKMTSEDGCLLNMAQDNLSTSFDDESLSDDDLDSENESRYLDRKSSLETSRREYIALSLNANRDPTKARSKLADLLGDQDDLDQANNFNNDNLKDTYHKIHKQFRKVGPLEDILKDPDQKYVEVTPDLVYKRSLVPGVGSPVDEDSLVIYNVAMWSENKVDPFDSTWLRRTTIVTDMSRDSLLPGLRDVLLTCRKAEWCEAIIRPKAAFGELGVTPRIPPNATIFCVLEVVKLIKKDKISWLTGTDQENDECPISFEDFWQASDEARKRGNYYHIEKQYRTALQRYKSGIRILETLTYKNGAQEEAAKDLLLKLYNNLAKTANAAGEPRLALYACKQASLLNEHDDKTYWQRLHAWKIRGHHEKALAVARRALQVVVDPSNKIHFKKEVKQLEAIIENDNNSVTNMYRLMARYLERP